MIPKHSPEIAIVDWHKDMAPANICVALETELLFYWKGKDQCYNVNNLTDADFKKCNVDKTHCDKSPYSFDVSKPQAEKLFFASGNKSLCDGNMTAIVAVKNNCTCVSAEGALKQKTFVMSKIKNNMAEIFKESAKPHSNNEDIITQFYNQFIEFNIFTQEQLKMLKAASPCSNITFECQQCTDANTEMLAQCIIHGQSNCRKYQTFVEPACDSCYQQLIKTCSPSYEIEKDPNNLPTTTVDDATSRHPCDRNCTKSDPLRCQYDLTIQLLDSDADGRRVDGVNRKVLAYNGQIPGPPIVICEGDDLVVNLKNGINTSSSKEFDNVTTLHFHGIREIRRPWADGVPFVTQCPILPNETFPYGFYAKSFFGAPDGTYTQTGTYWYHSHVGTQRTNGAYGALIVRPNKTETRFDVDNIIILQEWYENTTITYRAKIRSLLINGNGRVTKASTTNYTEYNITRPGDRYMFRVIGAISEDVPLRLSIEDHKFTVIAADSQDIESVENLDSLWIAGGERFHIVVKTKDDYDYRRMAYKIKVFGYEDPNSSNNGPYCTIAWLIYPGQETDATYLADCKKDFIEPTNGRTLNPTPINVNEWDNRLKYPFWRNISANGKIFLKDIRAVNTETGLSFLNGSIQSSLLNTQYIELIGTTFNNAKLINPEIPYLLQKKSTNISERCGTVCDFTVNAKLIVNLTDAFKIPYLNTSCSSHYESGYQAGKPCKCQNILQQPHAPGYWTELILINSNLNATAAHPIHQHGGWFWVVGMGKYDFNINSSWIKDQDTNCNAKKNPTCLERNLTLPVAKDTIQVPPGGYVILRTPLDNPGTWIIHCHINRHVNNGMAMILQIGGLGEDQNIVHRHQDWCTGPLEKDVKCKTSPPKINSQDCIHFQNPI